MHRRKVKIELPVQEKLVIDIMVWKNYIEAIASDPRVEGVVGVGDTVATALGSLILQLSKTDLAVFNPENASKAIQTIAFEWQSSTDPSRQD